MASDNFGHRTKFEKPCFYSLNEVFENEVCPNYPQKRPNLPELSAVAENVVRTSSGNFGQYRTIENAFLCFKSIFCVVCPCPNLPEVVFVVFGVQRKKRNAPGTKKPGCTGLFVSVLLRNSLYHRKSHSGAFRGSRQFFVLFSAHLFF
ncbi:hypothetical protein [Microcystis phage Mae-Yong924-2]|nr:hypothetical protein [Microcystis phage Mea-Yong924-1]QYC50746.1 hypothetical protein [Microcystis phage Mae-Yong924-2]